MPVVKIESYRSEFIVIIRFGDGNTFYLSQRSSLVSTSNMQHITFKTRESAERELVRFNTTLKKPLSLSAEVNPYENAEERVPSPATLELSRLATSQALEISYLNNRLIDVNKEAIKREMKGAPVGLIAVFPMIFREATYPRVWYISSEKSYKGCEIFLGRDGDVHLKVANDSEFLGWHTKESAQNFLEGWRDSLCRQ
ncbi:MAG: hypothetical protein OEX12_00030 [Gammaproteobacteria bacterium]|nr:hypothetical protein [Gammaproteobacteria bacterium]